MPKKEKKNNKQSKEEELIDRLQAQYNALKKLLQKFRPKNDQSSESLL